MAEITQNVNWLAILAGFVVAYGFGWIWYEPLFGKAWFGGQGLTLPEKRPSWRCSCWVSVHSCLPGSSA